MSKIPVAPYEVASNSRTIRRGDFLYLDGKKYHCPTITAQEFVERLENIASLLDTPYNRFLRKVRGLMGRLK